MSLWDRLRHELGRKPSHALAGRRSDVDDLEVQVATAVLLLEAAYGDEDYAWSEHRAILHGLREGFGIGKDDAVRLLERAEAVRPPVLRLEDVTDVVRSKLDEAQRREVVRLLWDVVAADDLLSEWEAAFVGHIARTLELDAAEVARLREEAHVDGLERR